MSRTKLILPITLVCGLMFTTQVYSQSSDARTAREAKLELIEAEFDSKMHEMEVVMMEHEVEQGKVELAKAELRLKKAEEEDDPINAEFARLELRQAEIALKMRVLRSEMARLQLKRVKTRFESRKPAAVKKQPKRARVQLEYDNDLDVVIIRGAKGAVDKIKGLLEKSLKDNDQ